MSTEPERNIEKTLKSYAKKRKEEAGAPLEMHPATRRLLQAEVARTFPKEARRSGWLNVFSGFWPRIALGGSIFIVLGIGIWVLVSGSQKQKAGNELALYRERESRTDKKDQLTPSRKLQLGIPQKQAVLSQEPVPETPPAPTPAPVPPAAAKSSSYQKEKLWVTNSLTVTNGVKNTPQLAKDAERLSDDAYHLRAISPSSQPTPATRSRSEQTVNKTEAAAIPQEAKPAAPSVATAEVPSPRSDSPLAEQYGTVVLSAPSIHEPTSGVAFGGALTLNSNFTANGGATQNGLAVWSAASVPNGASLLSAGTYQSSTQTFARRAGADFNTVFDLAQDKGTTGSTPLLNTFSFVQTGDQLRVVDGDGSVYYGYMETEDLSKAVLKSSENRAPKKTPALAEAQSWGIAASSDRIKDTPSKRQFFRVSGTNLTLKEPILFTGNIIFTNTATTQTLNFVGGSSLASSAAKPGAAGTNDQSGTNVQAATPALEGKVVIGGTNQIPIKAFRVAPGK